MYADKNKTPYDAIEDAEETDKYNQIDKSRDMLLQLLDDDQIRLSSEVASIVARAARYIN